MNATDELRISDKRRYPNGHWTPEQYRRRYLPNQLEAARRKVEMLEREARRLGIEV